MWPFVWEGALGVAVLVETDHEAVSVATTLPSKFTRIVPDACFFVGVTKRDQYPAFALDDFRDALAAKGHIVPVVRLDLRVASEVEFLVNLC